MSPIRYIETHIRDSQCLDTNLKISSTNHGSIPEEGYRNFNLGHGTNQKNIQVNGNGTVEISHYLFKDLIDRFIITEVDGTITLTETKTGQKLELVYELPVSRQPVTIKAELPPGFRK